MKNKMLLGTVLVGMLSMGQAFAGANSLQGATVTATYNGLASGMEGFDGAISYISGSSAKVDAANAEFFSLEPGVNPAPILNFMFDFDNAGGLTVLSNAESDLTSGSFNFTFDFGSTLSESISGFSIVDASAVSATPILSVLNDHKVSVSFNLDADHTWSQFSAVTTQLAFTAPVPEPLAPAMLLAGLGVLGLSRRFSKK